MTFQEISDALAQHLLGITDCPPIAWQNGDTPSGLPYLIAKHIPVSREDDTIDCTGPIQNGMFMVTVVTQRGDLGEAANTLAQQIADRFKKGVRITAGAGKLAFNFAAEPVEGFHDKAENWCVPVRARYITED